VQQHARVQEDMSMLARTFFAMIFALCLLLLAASFEQEGQQHVEQPVQNHSRQD
jgi:hypothetical protein